MAAGASSTPGGAPQTQKVSEVVASFRPTKLFRAESPKTSVTSLDFDDSGELAVVARDDDTLQIYNCKEGKHAKELRSQKYGVHLARFTHHAQSIIYASTKVDDGIRYLSSHDNSFIRYFKGHTDTVTCLSLNPSNDTFVSCSTDNTVRLWALNSPHAQGLLKLHAPHLAAYDPSASVLAIAAPPTQSILLYDLRNFDKAPFATFDLHDIEQQYTPGAGGHNWSKLEFTNDGKHLVLGTTGVGHFVLDAFEGTLSYFLARDSGPSGRRAAGEYSSSETVAGQGDLCVSPDGQYVIGGCGSDELLVWDIHSRQPDNRILRPFTDLPGRGKAAIVGYNQRMNLLCSADKDFLMWLPDPDAA